MQSAIYTGQVYHKRYEPVEHTLRYRTFYLLLDLDEAEQLNEISRLFGYNRRAWFCFKDNDFGPKRTSRGNPKSIAPVVSLKSAYRELLEKHAIRAERWSLQILTMPRILGYAFNPISLIYCRDESGVLRAMIYEVNNTFDERIHYVLPVTGHAPSVTHRCAKEMFVSPFFDLEGHYAFNVGLPQQYLNYRVDYLVDETLKLRASFCGERRDLNPSTLRKLALYRSGAAVKVIAGIHWEAVKLWWKGLPIVNHVPLVSRDDNNSVGFHITPVKTTALGSCPSKISYIGQDTTTSFKSEPPK
ncbi:MAG: DUF1365 domain-containing protein [Gammaproteobacteria bacterium]